MKRIGWGAVLVAAGFVAGAVLAGAQQQPAPSRVVCESGAEQPPAHDERDPYLVWRATCNADDANGRPILVEMID